MDPRAALVGHQKHRERTDEAQLFDHCLRLAPEKDFFIRKAIGWALREYSKTRPEAVKAFIAAHCGELSGLSIREGLKRIDAASRHGKLPASQSRAARENRTHTPEHP